MVSLHFQTSLLELDPDEVNQFLFSVAEEKAASSACFKHTVLRFFFRLSGLEDRVLRLPRLRATGSYRLCFLVKSCAVCSLPRSA
jgi:hypothetical protein